MADLRIGEILTGSADESARHIHADAGSHVGLGAPLQQRLEECRQRVATEAGLHFHYPLAAQVSD